MATREVYQAVLACDVNGMPRKVKTELDDGTPADAILKSGLIAAMDEVGRRFSDGEMFLPDMIRAAKAMQFLTQGYQQDLATLSVPSLFQSSYS